ncbi:MAG TPA: ArsR family transcriptional regulator [Nitrospiraceae bacterium]|nr:MAG: hypothetical protein A2Z82_09995 [Nitrospirae bacterium GWA2_46_11]OGW23216.1 MAG: hypothetical protein A2X55_09610 [Nitrospirae bacterium GWB2_47_37]HAK87769.1 ArsR family transcriptional regulator [Nitrospiraceae bacterium]HCZ12377.1 ArsR family transcriptional regulator [Nitrospiraceae bacterium]
MKVKNIRIAIKADEDIFAEVKDVWRKLEKGERVKKHEGVSFETLDAMRKVLTEERIKILKTIKREHPQSIYRLAQILKRDVKNTYDDLKLLEDVGLLELKKETNGREKTTPVVNYDKILLEIAV